MNLGSMEVELKELEFYPLKSGSKTYNIEAETDGKLIRRAVFPKDVIVIDESKTMRLSEYCEPIFNKNKCLILQLESRGFYYDENGEFDEEANLANGIISKIDFGFICNIKYLELYDKLKEVGFLKYYNQRRYEHELSRLNELAKNYRYDEDGYGVDGNKLQMNVFTLLLNTVIMFEDWFLSYEVQSAETGEIGGGREDWEKTEIDLIEECIRRYVRGSFKTIREAFNWAASKYIVKGKEINVDKLNKRFEIEKSKGNFMFEGGKWVKCSKRDGDKIIE